MILKRFIHYNTVFVTHALLCLSESNKQSVDNGRFGCEAFLDLQKAFDTVNESILH